MADILATYTYTLMEDDTYSISCANRSVCTRAIIPAEYNGKKVTKISERAFIGSVQLAEVELSDNITHIDTGAFASCSSLTAIVLPDSVHNLGDHAFFACSGLKNVVLSNNISTIEAYTFSDCLNLAKITPMDSIITISNNAFANCTSLTDLTIPNTTTTLGDFAFLGCTSLQVAIIGDGITNISESTFAGCSSLTAVSLGNNVIKIGNYAFKDCRLLSEIFIPSSVKSIGNYSFSNCSSLAFNTLPNSIESIGLYAFMGCSAITSFTIPNSVTWISEGTFSGCTNLQEIVLPFIGASPYTMHGNNPLGYIFGTTPYLSGVATEQYSYDRGSSALVTYYIPSTLSKVTVLGYQDNEMSAWSKIPKGSFYNCNSLASIMLSDTITEIGEQAFYNCSNLSELVLPKDITWISEEAFNGCSSLTSLALPAAITYLGQRIFDNCLKLNTIILNSSIPPMITDTTFPAKSKLELVVPASSLSLYKSALNWADFADSLIGKGWSYFNFISFTAAIKRYINKLISSVSQAKVDKQIGLTDSNQVYGKRASGVQTMYSISQLAAANTIAQRQSDGRLSVGTPTSPTDAVTKEYVDNLVSKEVIFSLIQEYLDTIKS